MKHHIFEMPVYDGAQKVWRVLNLSTGTVYSCEHETELDAFNSIEHGALRGGSTVFQIGLTYVRAFLDHQFEDVIPKPVMPSDRN